MDPSHRKALLQEECGPSYVKAISPSWANMRCYSGTDASFSKKIANTEKTPLPARSCLKSTNPSSASLHSSTATEMEIFQKEISPSKDISFQNFVDGVKKLRNYAAGITERYLSNGIKCECVRNPNDIQHQKDNSNTNLTDPLERVNTTDKPRKSILKKKTNKSAETMDDLGQCCGSNNYSRSRGTQYYDQIASSGPPHSDRAARKNHQVGGNLMNSTKILMMMRHADTQTDIQDDDQAWHREGSHSSEHPLPVRSHENSASEINGSIIKKYERRQGTKFRDSNIQVQTVDVYIPPEYIEKVFNTKPHNIGTNTSGKCNIWENQTKVDKATDTSIETPIKTEPSTNTIDNATPGKPEFENWSTEIKSNAGTSEIRSQQNPDYLCKDCMRKKVKDEHVSGGSFEIGGEKLYELTKVEDCLRKNVKDEQVSCGSLENGDGKLYGFTKNEDALRKNVKDEQTSCGSLENGGEKIYGLTKIEDCLRENVKDVQVSCGSLENCGGKLSVSKKIFKSKGTKSPVLCECGFCDGIVCECKWPRESHKVKIEWKINSANCMLSNMRPDTFEYPKIDWYQ